MGHNSNRCLEHQEITGLSHSPRYEKEAERVSLALRFSKKFEKLMEGDLNNIALYICKQCLPVKRKKGKEKYFLQQLVFGRLTGN